MDRAIAWKSDGTLLRPPIPHNPNRETFAQFVGRVAALDDAAHVSEFDSASTTVGDPPLLLSASDFRHWVRDPVTNLPTAASVEVGAAAIASKELEDAIAAKKAEVDALYLQKIAITSWTNSANSTTYQVQSRPESQNLITGKLNLALAQDLPPTIKWRMLDNSEPTFSVAEFKEMALAVGAWVEANYFARTTHRDAIAALTTISAVEAYDFISTGWPT